MRRYALAPLFFVPVLASILSIPCNVFAQTSPVIDSYTFFGVGQPAGPVTPSHLRMHQPLYLLDLCRQVKAGRLGRQSVAPLVGGDMILSALLAMDLDSLYARLTAAQELSTVPLRSLWQRIL